MFLPPRYRSQLFFCLLFVASNVSAAEPNAAVHKTTASGRPSAESRPGKVKIAAISVATVDGMFDANYERAVRLVEISLMDKPDIIILPEAFAGGYCGKPLSAFGEDSETSPHLAKFRKLSADGKCILVVCYLEKVPGDTRVRNVAAIYDSGKLLGRHYKHSLWVDHDRPYRDEPSQMIPGGPIEVYRTRFGRFAVLICYENMVPANVDALRGKVDYILSPYNSEHDLSDINIDSAKRTGIPSAWVDRTGTVFCGSAGYTTNLGTGGIVDAAGHVVARSREGAEEISVGSLVIRSMQDSPN